MAGRHRQQQQQQRQQQQLSAASSLQSINQTPEQSMKDRLIHKRRSEDLSWLHERVP
ncbi:uncharacterized protein P174DRAFT_441094 [Aspergillus novofumigatus IBT 16806]|uniref:Uncharacterized protein n=1 Tax=Aspergillus novofumigatus (strain IBT 16806) TaxID=1392255 RepID=A0A2I1C885_ASPN1|nr:uncharacterized protein P174DRAFT_441094 [Aspergillus novofumigatus IBT 16806]PKX93833.1 hypothetical protein P174DRAFT_441094 [Aspergillus novofumigatus IBT 16806]